MRILEYVREVHGTGSWGRKGYRTVRPVRWTCSNWVNACHGNDMCRSSHLRVLPIQAPSSASSSSPWRWFPSSVAEVVPERECEIVSEIRCLALDLILDSCSNGLYSHFLPWLWTCVYVCSYVYDPVWIQFPHFYDIPSVDCAKLQSAKEMLQHQGRQNAFMLFDLHVAG